MTFNDIEVVYYDDVDGSSYEVSSKYLFDSILPNMNGAQSIQFKNNGITYYIFGNDEGPYQVIMHSDDYDFFREVYMDAHETIDFMHYVEGGLANV